MPGGVHENMRPWEPEEDRLIIELLSELGPRWSRIVKQLPGRTISSVRNRWQRIDKGRRLRDSGMEFKNRCQQCGEPKRGHVCFARMRPRQEGEDADPSDGASGDASGDFDNNNPQKPLRGESESSLAAALPDASDVEGDDIDDALDALVDIDTAERERAETSVPLISRMKSGVRICCELGFEALEAAANRQEGAPPADEADAHPLVISKASRACSERSVLSESDFLNPSRLPSLLT